MSLQLILGSSGAGKSYYLYQKIIKEALANENLNYLVIVPEQFTLQTQKDFVAMHPYKGIMNIDILSFLRLAYRVFDETGGNERTVLEDTGKSMIVRKVMEEKKGSLRLFGSSIKKSGFVEEVKSMISEIVQYSIEEEQLEKMIEITEKKPFLQAKLRDLLTVYQGFEEFLSEKYITAEEILDVLYDAIEDSNYIRNSVICFDGFTGFTPSQYKLLLRLMKLSKKVYITVTIDQREDISRLDEEFKLFHLSKKTILKLYQMALKEGVEVEKPFYAGRQNGKIPYRFQNSKALLALEHNLFRYPVIPFEEEQNEIKVHVMKNAREEVFFTIREVLHLVREEGYRYRDIAVVTGDIGGYGRIIEREYEKAGLPCFVDHKKDILGNPFVEYIRAILEILRKDFDYESMFRYLKCGLADLSLEEIDQLENYVLALGIRGYKKWSQEWKIIYRKDIPVDLEQINQYREEAIGDLGELKKLFSGKEHTVAEFTEALYDFIVKEHLWDKLEHYQKMFEAEGMPLMVKEYEQIYSIVMELFEHLVDLLGEETVTIKEYGELLDAGFAEAKVGFIPPGVDQIVVGDIERTRLKDIRVLFFIGVNDGIVPKSGGNGGILSDLDRELLMEHDMELAPTKRQSVYTEQFYLYLNMTKPQNRLYITYSKVSMEGKTLRPSFLIGKIQQLYPKLTVVDEEFTVWDLEHILGADRGMSYLLQGLRENNKDTITTEWYELLSWYYRNPEWKEQILHFLEGAFYSNENSGLTKAAAGLLYGQELTGSVTRLEQYAACAFSHFLTYGLGLSERKEYRLEIPDMGNIFHNALELFSRKLKENRIGWQTITNEERESLSTACVQEVASEYGNTILLSSKRLEYLIKRVERIVKRTTWALCEHMKKGNFEAEGYELQFSYLDDMESTRLQLNDQTNMKLKGRIDRLDVYQEEDSIYVKVIDYKSGNKSFDILDLYYGLQLQLVVYLGAAVELEQKNHPDKKIIPAGIFYYNIKDPMIDKILEHDTDEEETQEELLKELKMNGLVNSSEHIIRLLDGDFAEGEDGLKGSVKSKVIPVETGKEGTIGKRSNVAASKEFEHMTQFVKEKLTQYGKEILEGTTSVNPYKLGNRTACDYCNYNGICGFDKRLPGNTYRNLKKLEKEEVWREISGKDAVDGGSAEGN